MGGGMICQVYNSVLFKSVRREAWLAAYATGQAACEKTHIALADKWHQAGWQDGQAAQREKDAGIALTRIPDPHTDHEACTDCWLAKDIATAIRGQPRG